jgi:hypothetical protein
VQSESLVAIGWLSNESKFERGNVELAFFEKLTALCKTPWQPVVSAGSHTCELCQFNGPHSYSNVFIPFDGHIYVAPVGILHYIAGHWYKPPEVFIKAVMNCPPMNSMEYKKALLANGGRDLVKVTAQEKLRGPTQLSPESIDKIRALGLDVDSEPDLDPSHLASPNGYTVIKPTSTAGKEILIVDGLLNGRAIDKLSDKVTEIAPDRLPKDFQEKNLGQFRFTNAPEGYKWVPRQN